MVDQDTEVFLSLQFSMTWKFASGSCTQPLAACYSPPNNSMQGDCDRLYTFFRLHLPLMPLAWTVWSAGPHPFCWKDGDG